MELIVFEGFIYAIDGIRNGRGVASACLNGWKGG
jgi:hypothetical protein